MVATYLNSEIMMIMMMRNMILDTELMMMMIRTTMRTMRVSPTVVI